MSRVGGFSNQSSNKIILNVYDLHDNNDLLYQFGLGLFHSGVNIGREEYTFASGAGIFTHEPKQAPGAKLRESVDMGVYNGTSRDLSVILNEMRSRFGGNDYNILSRNCNNFADEFLQRVVGKELPLYVNRMATMVTYVSCLLPQSLTGNAPVTDGSENNNNNSGSSGSYGASKTIAAKPASFVGSGVKLGRSDQDSVEPTSAGLNDRRERMRLAALSRMEA